MSSATLPLIVLGGRDRRGSELGSPGLTPLSGYKALDLRIAGRPLIEHVIERWRAIGEFAPIYLAGPAERYRGVAPDEVELVDTDGGFGHNLMAGVDAVIERHGCGPTAVTTSDVLPDERELGELVGHYRACEPCDFWMPQIRVPDDPERLGASQWKPRYRIASAEGETPVETLPCHLVIADVAAVRLDLMRQLFDIAYRTRNQPIRRRGMAVARRLLGWLLRRDLGGMLRGRAPLLTWETARYGIAMARELAAGTISAPRLAELIRRIYVRRSHRRAHPERRGYLPVIDGLSLAKDIDTEGEAREIAAKLAVEEQR